MIERERTVWVWFVTCVATPASDNDIRDEGTTALASALERNSTLQHLVVYRECRGDAGVCVVCRVSCCEWRCDVIGCERTVWLCFAMCGDACIRERHW